VIGSGKAILRAVMVIGRITRDEKDRSSYITTLMKWGNFDEIPLLYFEPR
jgi:hypothetical protein